MRDERFSAAVDLATGSSTGFRRTARRFSICFEDAEDAYQRGLEILLTKAPTCDRAQLRPWLHTVIKHEALALRRLRERLLGPGSQDVRTVAGPEERAPERERARQTAEALGQLKRSEVQCMLLKALGYSYDEIAERTGYSWTKVNRSLSEGRRSFFELFDEISSGASCERIGPALVATARGDASAEQQRTLDAHLRGCAGCRTGLRERRAAPVEASLAISPAMLLAALRGSWWERTHDAVAGALPLKFGQLLELAGSHKIAAVAASTAALAGGAAVEHRAEPGPAEARAVARSSDRPHARRATRVAAQPRPAPERRDRPGPEPSEAASAPPAEPPTASASALPLEFEPAPATLEAEPSTVENSDRREFTP